MSEIIKALVKCQLDKRWGNPTRTRENAFFRSKYAPLDEIIEKFRPILADYDMIVSGYIQPGEKRGSRFARKNTRDRLIVQLLHVSGEYRETSVEIFGSGESVQTYGSGLSYAMRYGMRHLLGFADSDDDDGNIAAGNTIPPAADRQPRPLKKHTPPPAKVGMDEVLEMARLMAVTGTDDRKLMKAYKVESLGQLTPDQYAEAMRVLKAKPVIKTDEEADLEAEQRDIFKYEKESYCERC